MKVREVMVREVASISPDISVKEALRLLRKMKISGLPVIDSEKKLLGIFTEKEVLRGVLPGYIEKVGRFIYEEDPKSVRSKFQSLASRPVSELMRKDTVTIEEDMILCEAARLMLTKAARRIPVLNKEREVVGIIAREDILKALIQEAEWQID